MSRIPTDIGRIGIRPIARPVDTFVTPNARPEGQNSLLVGLAQSFASLDPTLNKIIERRQVAANDQAKTAATVDYSRWQFESMDAFKAAVSRGEIKEQDNPWYLRQMSEEVGRSRATRIVHQISTDWENSDLRHSDNPADHDRFFRDKLSASFSAQSPEEAAAMAPIFRKVER